MNTLRKICLGIITVFLLLSSGCSERAEDLEQVSKDEKIVIKFSHVVAETTPKGLAAQRFANMVKERTGGRVEIQVYPNSTLYKDGEEMVALDRNQVQIIAPATAKLGEVFPLWQLFDLPFLFKNESEVHRVMDGKAGKMLIDLLEGNSIKALTIWDNGFKQFTATVPLKKIDDFRGVKFRVMPGSKLLEEQFRQLKAITVPLAFNQVYNALKEGQVQASENTPSNIYSEKFYKVQPYLVLSNHGYLGYAVLVNTDFWEGLPEDIRLILQESLAEVTQWQREIAVEQNALDLEAIKSSGQVVVWELTEAEKVLWEEIMQPVYRQFEFIGGTSLLEEARRDLENP
ncbi:MAG: TRAP transporter substrate-binding protein [Bacillota bacterium]